MPRNKDLKRLVRTRMAKTGEAYTTARTNITKQPKPSRAASSPKLDYATLAGMADDKIKAKTGRDWSEWVSVLDAEGAATMTHRDISALVGDKYKVPDWWTQAVTVGYERIKGLRARGQRRDGSYEINKSRTFNVPVDELYEAWADAKQRKRWLTGGTVKVRTATAAKSMRLDWSEGGLLLLGFMSKGKEKSAVAVAHTKLPDKAIADRWKQYWSEQLDSLSEFLE
jgi:hypothetical protein